VGRSATIGISEGAPTRFTRWVLPGLGVKAVVIGGGYATGRELAEFFLSRGPWGGLFAILFAALLFSIFCSLTFVAARRFQTWDYKSFFKVLLGPAWHLFELAYLLFVVAAALTLVTWGKEIPLGLHAEVFKVVAGLVGTGLLGAFGTFAFGALSVEKERREAERGVRRQICPTACR